MRIRYITDGLSISTTAAFVGFIFGMILLLLPLPYGGYVAVSVFVAGSLVRAALKKRPTEKLIGVRTAISATTGSAVAVAARALMS